MCLIAFAIGANAGCPLLIAANRDEFFDRPTEALHRWTLPDGTAVLAGRDLRDGGTWLGVSESGRVAMLTNVRSAHAGPGRRSRGELPSRWLQADTDWDRWLAELSPGDYGGFNLVVGDFARGFWAWISNRDPAQPHGEHASGLHIQHLLPGVYGLSNAALDTPWHKTRQLTAALRAALSAPSPEAGRRQLTAALADGTRPSADRLPFTGVPADIEHALSSPFVDMSERGYGTRSSLLLNVAPDAAPRGGWRAELLEWTHANDPAHPHRWSEQAPVSAELSWPGPSVQPNGNTISWCSMPASMNAEPRFR